MSVADVLSGAARWHVEHADRVTTMRAMPEECVDLVCTDPPWGIKHDSNWEGSEWAGEIQGDDTVHTEWLAEAFRVLKHRGALYLFTRWDVEAQWAQAIRDAGFSLKQSIVWDRCTHGTGDLAGTYGPSHERILFASKGRHILNGPRLPDVWRINSIFTKSWKWHPHEKPIPLLDIPILASSNQGDVVFDPHGGSAATAASALKNGRRAIVCEIDDRYHAWSTARLSGAQRGDPERRQGDLFHLLETA